MERFESIIKIFIFKMYVLCMIERVLFVMCDVGMNCMNFILIIKSVVKMWNGKENIKFIVLEDKDWIIIIKIVLMKFIFRSK